MNRYFATRIQISIHRSILWQPTKQPPSAFGKGHLIFAEDIVVVVPPQAVVIPNGGVGLVRAEPEDFLTRFDDTSGAVCGKPVATAKGEPVGLVEDLARPENAKDGWTGLEGKIAYEFP